MDGVSYASGILKRAVTLDTKGHYTESMVCYQEGIHVLMEALKQMSEGAQREHIRAKVEEYMSRAEQLKGRVEKLKEDGNYREQLQIDEDSTGHSYDKIFGRFLDVAVHRVEVDDPYIRSPHQCDNFLRFVELCVRSCPNLRVIFLKTRKDELNHVDQAQRLTSISQSIRRHPKTKHCNVQVDYSDTLHDREIRMDNGWVVKIGRGLDYFKPCDRHSIGFYELFYRQCKATTIDIFHLRELVNK